MNELAPQQSGQVTEANFNTAAGWELVNRMAKAYAASSIVPEQYRNNVANCIVGLEMAHRMNASPLMVFQNLYLVHGNPGWSSKFLIACFNQCGRFSSLRYELSADRTACRAWSVERATNERIDGPEVSIKMAQSEGWSTKNGSKWKTMPELMLMYRSAAFLIRTYAPEISMGLNTVEELQDIEGPGKAQKPPQRGTVKLADLVEPEQLPAPVQPDLVPEPQPEKAPEPVANVARQKAKPDRDGVISHIDDDVPF